MRKLFILICSFIIICGLNAQIKTVPGPSWITPIENTGYWISYENKFFQIDLTPANPRLAGTGDQVVFYNTNTRTFNDIQVAENGAYPPTLNGLIHPVLPLNWP